MRLFILLALYLLPYFSTAQQITITRTDNTVRLIKTGGGDTTEFARSDFNYYRIKHKSFEKFEIASRSTGGRLYWSGKMRDVTIAGVSTEQAKIDYLSTVYQSPTVAATNAATAPKLAKGSATDSLQAEQNLYLNSILAHISNTENIVSQINSLLQMPTNLSNFNTEWQRFDGPGFYQPRNVIRYKACNKGYNKIELIWVTGGLVLDPDECFENESEFNYPSNTYLLPDGFEVQMNEGPSTLRIIEKILN